MLKKNNKVVEMKVSLKNENINHYLVINYIAEFFLIFYINRVPTAAHVRSLVQEFRLRKQYQQHALKSIHI